MALSFLYFISSIQIFNRISTTIMSLSRALLDDIVFQNIIFMVMCIYAMLAVDFFHDAGADGELEFEWCSQGVDGGRELAPIFDSATETWVAAKPDECPLHYTTRGNDFGHEYFGTFCKSLYTMFQVLTGDSWSEAIARPLLTNWGPWGPVGVGLFFVSFYLGNAVVLINVVVAVLLEKMVEEEPESDDEEEDEEDAPKAGAAPGRRKSVAEKLFGKNPIAAAAAKARKKHMQLEKLKKEGEIPGAMPWERAAAPPAVLTGKGKGRGRGRGGHHTAKIPAALQAEIYRLSFEISEIKQLLLRLAPPDDEPPRRTAVNFQ